MNGIKIGDTVTVYWVTNGEQLTGVVEHMPCEVGDLWHIRHSNGEIHAINPNCSNFEQICKLP